MSVNTAPEPVVVAAPVEQVQVATPVDQVARFSPQQTQSACILGLDSNYGIAKQNIQVGLQSEDGSFIDFSKQLPKLSSDGKDNPDYIKLETLLIKYDNGRMNFAINLSDLKDGDGRVLGPVDDDLEAFEQDMADLRAIAKKTLGVETWHWNSYPHGYRAIVGTTQALHTDHSARLQENFDFDTQDLKEWLEAINAETYTPDPNIKDVAQQNAQKETWEKGKETRMVQAVKGFHAAMALMGASRKAVTKELEALEAEAKAGSPVPEVGFRIAKLRKQLATLPHGKIPENSAEAAEARTNGQMTTRAAILYAASHLHHGEEQPDLEKMRADAEKHLNSIPLPDKDRSDVFSRITPKKYGDVSPDHKKAERNFLNSLELLSLNIPEGDRQQFESCRKALEAEERSDGPELFFVGAVSAIVTNPEKIGQSVTGSASQIAFGKEGVVKDAIGHYATLISEAQSKKPAPSPAVMHNPEALIQYYNIPIV